MEAKMLFHADGQRDMTKPILTFHSFVNMSKKKKSENKHKLSSCAHVFLH